MNTQTLTPASVAYLEAVRHGLADLSDDDRDEVLADLEAHLADLETDDPVGPLGTPEDFVREFRMSAGLDVRAARPGSLRRWSYALGAGLGRLAQHPLVGPYQRRRSELRVVWAWTRGWIFVAAIWWIESAGAGWNLWFGIPGSNVALGIVLVALATALSVWLASARTGRGWAWVDRLVTVGSILLAVIAWSNPIWVNDPASDDAWAQQPLFSNVFAYDREGNPVDVLLYDQDGNPIEVTWDGLGAPDVTYDMNGNPITGWDGVGDPNVTYDQWGPIRFEPDKYGRPVTNLYPLDRLFDGTSQPVPPPRVAIPEFDGAESALSSESAADDDEAMTPSTTTTSTTPGEVPTTTTVPPTPN